MHLTHIAKPEQEIICYPTPTLNEPAYKIHRESGEGDQVIVPAKMSIKYGWQVF